jgi:putative acetyltransferase
LPSFLRRAPAPTLPVVIREARTARQIESVRALLQEYRTWLVEHREVTAFPDPLLMRGLERFDREMASLPGEYAPPRGALFVAYQGTTALGCAALRPLADRSIELKRVFVRTDSRQGGVGHRLTERALEKARRLGAPRVVLDTLPGMTAAISLYRSMGFREIPAYWPNPVPTALYFEYRWEPTGSAETLERRAAPRAARERQGPRPPGSA